MRAVAVLLTAALVAACGGDSLFADLATEGGAPDPDQALSASTTSTTVAPTTTAAPTTTVPPTTTAPPPPPPPADDFPDAGNPDADPDIPAEARAADTSHPDRVIGDGSAASCTSAAVVEAVAAGGIITFDCGPDPVTITMAATAKVRNDTGPEIVLDGGGKVTLSGGGSRRILYMNTCDEAQVWTTDHCDDQDHPRLTVQGLTFVDGNSTGDDASAGGASEVYGGGAIFVRGGRLKVVGSRFFRNRCDETGPDLGGAAIRVLSQSQGLPVNVVSSTFGDGVCSNGGALSSIGVSWDVYDSVFTGNDAVGNGANPARGGTPGGGSGGAIYLDGNLFTLRLIGTRIAGNHANEGGGAVFFVSNDRTGSMTVDAASSLSDNPSDGFETYPGIFFLGTTCTSCG